MEELTIYQGNSGNIRCTITAGIDASTLTDDAYIAYLIVKKNASDSVNVIDLSTNVWDSSTAVLSYTTTDSSIEPGKYIDEFYISSSDNVFTVGIGDFYVVDSLSK